ncbi:MAG: hypothetical protein UZ18_ATM001000251 [Armatimonadetes bacterium OLB18]|nr:MAG: hypothetical protein UZ18_ATM001000251 [Armatimonadetes bacterium OLB18]
MRALTKTLGVLLGLVALLRSGSLGATFNRAARLRSKLSNRSSPASRRRRS